MDGGATRAAEVAPEGSRPLWPELLWAMAALAVAVVLSLYDFAHAPAVPVAVAVVPVMALSMVARPWVTVATGGVAVGGVLAFYSLHGAALWFTSTGRIVAALMGIVVAGVMSAVRLDRDRELTAQVRNSARLEAEAQLGRWLALVTERSDVAAWEWRIGSPLVQSRGLATLLGLPADEEVTSQWWRSRLDPDAAVTWVEAVRVSLKYAAPMHDVHQVRLPDGTSRWLEVRGEPLVAADGRVQGLVGTAADVTARVEVERREREHQQLSVDVVRAGGTLAVAADSRVLMTRACKEAYDLFDADAVSIWQVGEDGLSRLLHRLPETPVSIPRVVPITEVFDAVPDAYSMLPRVVRFDDVTEHLPLGPDAPRLGVVAPIRAGTKTVAYLAFSWNEVRPDPDREWLTLVDTFATQLALAASVVARREAEASAAMLAARLQEGLSATTLHTRPEWDVATLYRPGERRMRLGGDFLDTWSYEDGAMAFVLGDVSGHGPEQAALGVMLRSAWVGAASSGPRDPAAWATVLRDVLELRRSDDGVFATFVTGVVRPDEGAVDLVCAGHPAPVVLGGNQVRPLRLQPQLPAGVVDGLAYEVESCPIDAREALLLFSDGLFEGRDEASELGYEGLLDALRREQPVDDEGLLRLVREVERRHHGIDDDVAVLLLRRSAESRRQVDLRRADRERAAG